MGLFDGLDLEKLDAALSNLRVLKEFEQRPNRIILVRHGESEGNIDRSAYSTTPDSQIALTEHGFAQGAVAGLQIRQLIGNETVRFFVSPYLRARQTLLAILRAFDGQTVKVSSEPRLREQDFGNFQSHEAMRAVLNERQKFGRFYYRFPNGEAGTDVFDRMASFITYLFRTMSDTTKGDYFESAPEAPSSDASTRDENYVLVTHGLLMRIFCMCYLRWTVYEFEQVWNPSNCEIWVLEKSQQSGTYALAGRWRASPYRGKFMDIQYGESRKEPLPEYMKRPLVSRTVRPGSADALERPELGFLRSASKCLPKPRPRRANALIDTRRMFTANAVIDYWTKDKRTDYWGLDNRAAAWMARSSGGSSNSPRTSEEQCGDDDECLAECDGLGGGRDRVADEGGDPVDRVLYSSISGDPVGASTEESTAQRASGEASPVKSGEAIWKANLESMNVIDRMLTQETIAPQWGESEPSVSAAGLLTGSRIRPKLPPLRVEELDELARMEDLELPLSEHEMELLKRSLSSLNYLGDWSDPEVTRDSIVRCCAAPRLITSLDGDEYTCACDAFTPERKALHERIVQMIFTSALTAGRFSTPSVSPRRRLGPLTDRLATLPQDTHVFIVVGVPGSGKDTVLKRYLRTLGLPLLDASADLIKEYLAAWGDDELSVLVRQNNEKSGPGKHLLHSQYLHRESILLNHQVADRALAEGRSIILEKTLHDADHVLTIAHRLAERGCKVHLFGTHITPLTNWKFLRNRMLSGQAFGRFITKEQTVSTLRAYHKHFSAILADPDKRAAFDSIHLFDVQANDWVISISDTSVMYPADDVEDED